MTRRTVPDGYSPLAFCRECGRDFSGDTMFDRHRVGVHDYTFADGLRRDPPYEDGRRCLDDVEMRERGWRPLTDWEMSSSRRDRHRVGFGVELWHDPVRHARGALLADGVGGEASEGVTATSDPLEALST